MIKTILVPATGAASDDAIFATALQVARRLDAQLDFLHVRLDPAEVATAMASDVGGGIVSAGLIDRLEEEAAQRETKARQLCSAFCAREGVALDQDAPAAKGVVAHWHREVGREADWVAEYGRTADLVVVGRPGENQGVMGDTLEAALLDTGRPLLIPGSATISCDTIAIAWKSTREAARAVAAAAAFLDRAKRVVILTASESDRLDREGAARLLETLRRHGLTGEIRQLHPGSRKVAELLLDSAREVGVGLLVMGGYGHSRLREMVFGGVTEHMLRAADLPILMAH
jgi:nucleotide-binding universal stress UspA family protein